MIHIKATFRDYPMLGYFLNMFNASQPPRFALYLERPTTDKIDIELRFYEVDAEPDYDKLAKMVAAAYGTVFSVSDIPLVMEPQSSIADAPEISINGSAC